MIIWLQRGSVGDFRKRECFWCSLLAAGQVFEHWQCSWIHLWSMYNWTYREGLKLLVGVWMNHLYIQQHIKKKKKKDKGIHDDECFLIQACVFTCFINVFYDEWVNNFFPQMTTHQKAALSGDHRSEFIFLVLSICARCSGNHSNKVILGNSNVKTPQNILLN